MIRFVSHEMVRYIHETVLDRFGGARGLRYEGLLDAALAQPRTLVSDRTAPGNIFDMAAAYCYHLYHNQPFSSCNGRTAFLTMYAFLNMNGRPLNLSQKQAFAMMLKLSTGELDKRVLASILRETSEPARPDLP